jgi:hypothetical protein
MIILAGIVSISVVSPAYAGLPPPEMVLICYLGGNDINPPVVAIEDQFGRRNVDPAPAQRVCEEGLKHSTVAPANPRHWVQYEYNTTEFSKEIVLKDQFGTETGKAEFPFALMVPALKNDQSPPNPQHWTQYSFLGKIDPPPVVVTDQFGTSFVDAAPSGFFLSNTFKNGIGLPDGQDMKCYDIVSSDPFIDPLPHQYVDQFGNSTIDPAARGDLGYLCTIAQKSLPEIPVGGELLSIDMTSLFVAGALANAGWIIPIVGVTAAGIIGFVLRKRIR